MHRGPPLVPAVVVCALLTLSLWAIASGLLDLVVPRLADAQDFEGVQRAANLAGPAGLGAYVLLHNLGLAALVPGVGLVACALEPSPRRRRLVAAILLAAVVVSLLVATELVIRRGYWRLPIVLPLLVLESAAVLMVAIASYRALASYVPTPRPEWSWIIPLHKIAAYFAIAVIALAFGAFVEVLYIAASSG